VQLRAVSVVENPDFPFPRVRSNAPMRLCLPRVRAPRTNANSLIAGCLYSPRSRKAACAETKSPLSAFGVGSLSTMPPNKPNDNKFCHTLTDYNKPKKTLIESASNPDQTSIRTRAEDGIRTRDLSITNRLHYPCATSAKGETVRKNPVGVKVKSVPRAPAALATWCRLTPPVGQILTCSIGFRALHIAQSA
jgi:hypothetical protein